MIKHVGRKWVLFTSGGDRVLGRHDTQDEAIAQERAIQARKHARAGGGGAKAKSSTGVSALAKVRGRAPVNRFKLKRIEDGVYEGDILGVPVRVVRGIVGVHPHYHTFNHQPEWKVRHRGQILVDGHGTMSGAVDAAERTIRSRGLDQTEEALARAAAHGGSRGSR